MRIDIELLRAVAGADTMIPGAGQLIPPHLSAVEGPQVGGPLDSILLMKPLFQPGNLCNVPICIHFICRAGVGFPVR